MNGKAYDEDGNLCMLV